MKINIQNIKNGYEYYVSFNNEKTGLNLHVAEFDNIEPAKNFVATVENLIKDHVKTILDELYHNSPCLNEKGQAYNQAIQDIAGKLNIVMDEMLEKTIQN